MMAWKPNVDPAFPYICPICGQAFSREGADNLNFRCEDCGVVLNHYFIDSDQASLDGWIS